MLGVCHWQSNLAEKISDILTAEVYTGKDYIRLEEAEKIIMDGISHGAVMPYADTMLDGLNEKGIRTAVISNNRFSGVVLKEQLDRLLPRNRFEFVLASSDYIFRKPHSLMFETVLRKSELTADKVWYCGDSMEKDVYGANSVGMFSVLYEGRAMDELQVRPDQNNRRIPDFEYLYIQDCGN